ncbi:MAG: NUDIX hydrolase [bacterium]|nr:NUDIX hydrolase [bacterium]
MNTKLKIPPEEFYKSLPKKRMGAAVLLFNGAGDLLLVKPNYRDQWSLPGGVVDAEESPRAGAIREVYEEIGLTVHDLLLCAVGYAKTKEYKTEALHFVFSGGVLTDEQIAGIVLQEDEIDAFQFVPPEDACPLLIPSLCDRVPAALLALKNKTVVYRES